nr:DUF5693 family protein [Ornithinibacillus scapharcae]
MSSKKRIILWIITIVLLLASLPGIINRWQTESENNEYEIVVPYDEIFTLTEEGTVTVDEALSTLKDAGLTTVSVQPITLANWELMGIIQMYTEEELNQLLRFSNHQLDLSQERNGFYITLPSDPYYLDKIKEYFEPEEIPINGMSVYFIPSDNGIGLNTSLGYDEQIINNIKSHGLSYILRVENNDSETNYRDVESITNLNGHTSAVLFSGEEVIGYPEIDELKDHVSTLSDAGYSLYMIEFSAQKGMQTAARETDYDIIRLHSLRIAKDTLPADIDKAVRAIKERNIKTIFFRLPFEEAIQSLEMGVEFIEGVTDKLPDHFTPGVAAPFEKIEIPIWSQIASLLAGVLFMTLAALEVFKDRRLHLAAPIIMAALTVAYLLTDRLAILQVFALLVAVVAPIYAVLSARNLETTNIGKIILAYLKAIAITLVGIMIVVGLLNGNAFITGFEVFRGVKLVYVIPITFVLIFVLWFGNMVNVKSTKAIVTFMNAPVRYWQVIVMLIFAAAAFYYITRTGNAGTVSDLELAFRQKLEDVLYVRPRTKEFLIGFPLFIVGLYIMGMSKWGKLLLVPGVIGFLSIMNTFTHFHIPLGLSLLRTVYSVVLGLVIGLILIAIVKFVINFVRKHWNKELTS